MTFASFNTVTTNPMLQPTPVSPSWYFDYESDYLYRDKLSICIYL